MSATPTRPDLAAIRVRAEYRTIVADPPWTPAMSITNGGAPKASPQRHYPVMSTGAIAALNIPAAGRAHLYLWCLAQNVDEGYAVARAWGFLPIITWTWRKSGLGCGRFRCNTEHVVVARKGPRAGNPFGSGGRHAQATNGTCFDWPRGRHSAKPEEFYALVESLSPGPRLEMFARARRPGWDAWGNEVPDQDLFTCTAVRARRGEGAE